MRDAVYKARTGRSLLPSILKNAKGVSIGSKKTKNQAKPSPGAADKASAAADAQAKMKDIVMRRKLTDLVRAQSDEIEFLKHELETLRERNFPRFANPSAAFAEKSLIPNPDSKK
jgi:hypothetical protein